MKKKPTIDEDAAALELGRKLVELYRKTGHVRLHLFRSDDGCQASLSSIYGHNAMSVETRPHPAKAAVSLLDNHLKHAP